MRKDIKTEFTIIEELIRKIYFFVSLRSRDVMLSYGLNNTQFQTLEMIYQKSDITTGELTKKLGFAQSSMTDIIKKLVDLNLIERYKDEEDKRVYRFNVSEKGEELVEFAYFRQMDYYFGLCRDFKEWEMEIFIDLLRKMEQRIDEAVL